MEGRNRAQGSIGARSATGWGVVFALAAALLSGCSAQKLVADRLGSALAAGGSVWAEDDDPDLVGDALPFALKTMESLVAASPGNPKLLLGACRGFTSYAAGWVEPAAEDLSDSDFEASRRGLERARRLYLRARGYCLRALERRSPGVSERLALKPEEALGRFGPGDVELLYWTGASWGSAVSLGLDRPESFADLGAVRAIFERALALQPDFDRGALEEAMISVDAVSETLGGSPERARAHFERAVELSHRLRASPYVTWARTAAVAAQDRRGFREALEKALALDPDGSPPDRLANLLAQRRARRLLERADELFYAEE